MKQCQFIYADGSRCQEQVRASEYGETITFKGYCPTEDREVTRCYKPAIRHFRYCHYHRRVLRGEITPSNLERYSHLNLKLRREAFEKQFVEKKEIYCKQLMEGTAKGKDT